MKKLIIGVLLIFAFGFNAAASYIDTIYAYNEPYQNDSSKVYVVVDHYFGVTCSYLGYTITLGNDSIGAKFCYSLGITGEFCDRLDTAYAGIYLNGTYVISCIISVPYTNNCDTIYEADTLNFLYTIVSAGIHQLTGIYIVLSPNPTTNKLTCTLSASPKQAYYRVISVDGKVLINNTAITHLHFEVDVSPLAGGMYYLVLQDDKERTVKRFVKE